MYVGRYHNQLEFHFLIHERVVDPFYLHQQYSSLIYQEGVLNYRCDVIYSEDGQVSNHFLLGSLLANR